MANPFFKQHFISVDQLDKDKLLFLFKEIDAMKDIVLTKGKTNILEGKIIGCLFLESSTRTFGSFSSAIQRLGAGVISFQGMTHDSEKKWESLDDTIKAIGCSTDAIVLRHYADGIAEKVAQASYVPIINAGDGGHEHPTQSLLEAYTVRNHFSSFQALTIGMIGDLKHSRTIRSFSKIMAKLGVKKFIWVSPDSLRMLPDVVEVAKEHHIEVFEASSMAEYMPELDVLYVNRIQKERFKELSEYDKVKNLYVTTPQTIETAKKSLIILDPLPRIEEITRDVDTDPRALYIKEEMQNGLYTRMALLKLILSE